MSEPNFVDRGELQPHQFVASDRDCFHLASLLTDRLPSLRKRYKRLRTRAQLLAATAREIERVGYEGLTVDGITESAGIARSTFYLYFRDRAQAAMTVMRIYISLRRHRRPRGGSSLPVRQSIERHNAYYLRVFALNAKLLIGRESLIRDRNDLAQLSDRINAAWTETVINDVQRRYPRVRGKTELDLLRLRIRGAIAMTDELLRQIYLLGAPGLESYVDQECMLITGISEMWYRLVYVDLGA